MANSPNYEELYLLTKARAFRSEELVRKIRDYVGGSPPRDPVLVQLIDTAKEEPRVRSEFDAHVTQELVDALLLAGAPITRAGQLNIVAHPSVPRDVIIVSDGARATTFKLVNVGEKGSGT